MLIQLDKKFHHKKTIETAEILSLHNIWALTATQASLCAFKAAVQFPQTEGRVEMILCDDQPRVTDVEHGHSASNLKHNIPLRTITGGEKHIWSWSNTTNTNERKQRVTRWDREKEKSSIQCLYWEMSSRCNTHTHTHIWSKTPTLLIDL